MGACPSPKERLWRGQRCGDLGRVPYLTGGGEGMGGGGAFGDDFGGRGLPADGARDRLLDRAIVEVLDLLVVAGFPMDEHADANEEIVGLVGGNHALGDAVGDRLGDRVLRGAEHLHGLLGALDRHFVEHDVAGLVSRFGVSTASSEVNPSLLLVRQWTKAVSAELPRGPMSRSICATSLPSPTNDSPTHNLLILAMSNPPGMKPNPKVARCGPGVRRCDYPCCSVRKGNSSSPRGPVGRIALTAQVNHCSAETARRLARSRANRGRAVAARRGSRPSSPRQRQD